MASLADALMGAVPQLTARKAKEPRNYKRKPDTPPPEHGRNQYTGGFTPDEVEARMKLIVETVRAVAPGKLVAKSHMQRQMKFIVGLMDGLELAHEQGYLCEVKLRAGCVTYMRTNKE